MFINIGKTSINNTFAKIKPNVIEIAIGIKNCADLEVSNNKGVKPTMVVNVVNTIDRKRWQVAFMIF